jgi:hypothetical protein
MTDEQRTVVDAIQSGPRGAGLRGPFNALVRSPALCDLVQRVGAYVRFGSSIPSALHQVAQRRAAHQGVERPPQTGATRSGLDRIDDRALLVGHLVLGQRGETSLGHSGFLPSG